MLCALRHEGSSVVDLREQLQSGLGNRYQIERELGRGGMATVYLARDLRHERAVAIKVLRPEIALVVGSERFLREIRLAAQLRHPHILPLYDSGTLDPDPISGPTPLLCDAVHRGRVSA
jgi:serine/threonine protein kinase